MAPGGPRARQSAADAVARGRAHVDHVEVGPKARGAHPDVERRRLSGLRRRIDDALRPPGLRYSRKRGANLASRPDVDDGRAGKSHAAAIRLLADVEHSD